MIAPSYDQKNLAHFYRLRAKSGSRDRTHEVIHAVREGGMRQLFPEELGFSLSFEGVPIANFIDNVSRDLAETLAPLPSLDCVSGKMKTDADMQRAATKNRIGFDYWLFSRLENQLLTGADRYLSYGFLPMYVEPNVLFKKPYLCLEDPRYSYYENDRFGNCKVFANRKLKSVDDLCAEWPEWEGIIRKDPKNFNRELSGDTQLEEVKFIDNKRVTLFLPQRDGFVLGSYEHKMSRTPVWVAERPGDTIARGQFDDVVWVQVARGIMALLALEGAHMAVQAPIAAPDDMDEFPLGPHAILQSQNARDIHRVNLEIPPTAFAEVQNLNQELKTGSRYPDARSGGVEASVITGKGVEALLGTFDTQIKAGQMVLKEALQTITSMAFEMDEAWWPKDSKTITGYEGGGSYEFSYTPAEAINGRWNCIVTYGFAAGMHPAQSFVSMLQLEGAGIIAKATTQANLPFSLDPVQEQRKIHIEKSREALEQGMFALIQSTGALAAQGQDPMPFIQLAVNAIKGLQNGSTIEDAVDSAYQQMEQAKQQQAQEQAAQQQAAGAPGGPGGGIPPDGLPPGVAPGQAGQPPGGLPAIADMAAGFRGNADLPTNSFTIRRREAV